MSKRKTPAIEDPVKPASTAELRREGRLARIAKALVSGASVTDIAEAEAEGISRTLASREANSPECRQLVAEFVSLGSHPKPANDNHLKTGQRSG